MGETGFIITLIIFNIFFIAFICAIVIYIRQYRIKKKENLILFENQHREHQRELLSTQIEIQNQTMQHIGREIHDNIGQKLTLASLYTQQLAYENKAPQITESIENISTIINESLSELRQLSKSLTDDTINDLSIIQLLLQETEKINELKKVKVIFNNSGSGLNPSYQIKSVLLRICQEFIQNSIKHSDCKNIYIDLTNSDQILKLQLKDDGIGFDINKESVGIGLKNIKKRSEMIGGKYYLESTPDSGTQLSISIQI